MKKMSLSMVVLFGIVTCLFAAEKEKIVDPYEKQLLDIIEASKKCVGILKQIKDEASADKHRDELNKIRVRFQVLKAKNKALGAPAKEKELEIVKKLGKDLFKSVNSVQKELNRIQSLPKVYEKLKDILNDLNPNPRKRKSEPKNAPDKK